MMMWSAILLFGVAVAAGVAALPQIVMQRLRRHAQWIDEVVRRFTPHPVDPYHWAIYYHAAALTLLVVLIGLLPSLVLALLLWAVALYLPGPLVEWAWQYRRRQIEQQLPVTIASMSNNMQAGLSLVQSIHRLSKQAPEPSRTEFRIIANRYQHGVSLEEAILEAKQRLALPNFNLFASAVLVNREMGGDVARTLDRVSKSLERLQEMHETVQSATAEGRTNIKVLLVSPAAILAMVYVMDPEGVAMLFQTVQGWAVLLLAGLLVAGAAVWASKILGQEL